MRRRLSARQTHLLCRAALLCALLCVLSVISIPVGTIPVTAAVFGVFLCGILLPPRYALAAVCGYLALGLVGLPVFSSFGSGIGVLLGPTGGYLWGYPLMALLPSLARRTAGRIPHRRTRLLLCTASAVLSLLLCYAAGTAWYCILTRCAPMTALTLCVLPFVPFDLLKLAAAMLLGSRFPTEL